MLNVNFEFRKGIFFIRLIGDMDKENYCLQGDKIKKLIIDNKFKYIVLNTNYLNKIDLDGLNYIIDIYNTTKRNNSFLVICDKSNVIKRLLNGNVPNIEEELEVL